MNVLHIPVTANVLRVCHAREFGTTSLSHGSKANEKGLKLQIEYLPEWGEHAVRHCGFLGVERFLFGSARVFLVSIAF